MLKLTLHRFFILYLILVFAQNSFGQNVDYKLSGRILDESGEGLMATIFIHELGKGTAADLDGNYKIPKLRPGNYHLHITHIGYKSQSQSLTIKDSDVEFSTVMIASAIQLESLTIEANPFKNGPLEQSQTILVIDRDYIERNNAGTFANTLEKLPGISTINTGVGIAKPVIRGMSFNRILINDRGIKQEGQQWGADHGLEIDPFDVDRVEIIKGPASLMYGSDGMAGVINISPPAFKQDGEIEGAITSMYQSNNDMLSNSAFIAGNEADFVFNARFTMQDFADYRVPAENFSYAGFVLPIFENRLKNTAGSERHFSAMGGIKKQWGYSTLTISRFQQKAGIFVGAVGVPRSYNLRPDGDSRNIDIPRQESSHLKVIWNNSIMLQDKWLELDLGYQKNIREEYSLPHAQEVAPDNPFGNLALALNLDVFTANARLSHQKRERGQEILGISSQFSKNSQSGFEFLLPNYESFQGGLFYFREIKFQPNLIFNAGARIDGAYHNIQEHLQPVYRNSRPTGEVVQRNPDIKKSFINWSASSGFSWLLDNHYNLKFNLGTAFRIPTPIELSSNGVHHGNFRHELGNPNLERERSYQADLNLAYSNRKVSINLSPFAGYFDGYIYLAPSARFSPLPGSSILWEYRQNDAVFLGGEISADINIIKNFTLNLATEYVYNQNLDTNLPLPLTPPFSTFAAIEYRLPLNSKIINNLRLYVDARLAADQNRVDRNEKRTKGYKIFGAGVSWDTMVKSQKIQFQLSGQNLTNEFYLNHLSRYRLLNLPEQGRNITLNLKIPISIR